VRAPCVACVWGLAQGPLHARARRRLGVRLTQTQREHTYFFAISSSFFSKVY
jgi:hypothetical protein